MQRLISAAQLLAAENAPGLSWSALDPTNWSLHTAITVTAALAAMSCALPGVWLVLRRQSMMGDALSHSALPGIVAAFLVATAMRTAGWISPERFDALEHLFLFAGAVAAGLATAWLTEWIQEIGHVEGSAALGVVFSALFALGLFLVRFAVDDVDLDTDCVLFGRLVETALETTPVFGHYVPTAALVNGGLLLANLALVVLLFKEMQIAAFDPGLATTQGVNARAMHYGHMAATALTVVAAFETVGSILVIGLLVVPAATAQFLTDRLKPLIALSLLIAAASAVVGHWLSQTIPGPFFARVGFPQVEDASTPGMIAVASGGLFLLTWIAAPRHGLLARAWHQLQLARRIVGEDLLGHLYRQRERHEDAPLTHRELVALARRMPRGAWLARLALGRFARKGLVSTAEGGYVLTSAGAAAAREVVRSHRLWESYLDRHFDLPSDHLHASAHRAEHYLNDELRRQLSSELDQPTADPHGSRIPSPAADEPSEETSDQPRHQTPADGTGKG
jgi:manganese/zinc/iron transport system permease protein